MAGSTTANRASGARRSSLSTRLAVVTVAKRCEASAQGATAVGGPWGGDAPAQGGGGGGRCGNTVDSVQAYPSHQRCPGPPAGSGYQPGARPDTRSASVTAIILPKAGCTNRDTPYRFPPRPGRRSEEGAGSTSAMAPGAMWCVGAGQAGVPWC